MFYIEINCTSSVINGINTVLEEEYYEYDSTGNITGIYKLEENEKVYYNKYYYDEANQIVREDNRLGGFTSTYTYDVGGNIVSHIRYPYTENETISSEAIETHTYSYENSQWGDVLTAYNGQPVLYDAMGNITSLNGDTYIWTGGRQLSRITKADNSYIDYFYDDNGQLSMYKMYDSDGALDGGAEYYWEGTKLIAVKLIENETETDGMSAFMRILYDAKDEPLGFLLNDAMPFLYTKSILGDITGVVYYETAEYLFRYAYDAYGNYKLIPADNSPAAEVMAIMFHTLNPLTYRGYVFAPAIGICHYLGSRFYSPMLCRFMNADIYADTAQGVVGTNMFAYCNNNPIRFIDPEGTYSGVLDREKNKSGEVVSIFTIFMLLITAITLIFNPSVAVSYPDITISSNVAKTRTLSDVYPKVRRGGHYRLAYIKNNKLNIFGSRFTFTEAIQKLGFSGASNQLSQRFTYNTSKYSPAYNSIRQKYKDVEYWGIYADSQSDAKALAVVFGCSKSPEVHLPGYGHYHDSKHAFHIWYGDKI